MILRAIIGGAQILALLILGCTAGFALGLLAFAFTQGVGAGMLVVLMCPVIATVFVYEIKHVVIFDPAYIEEILQEE